MDGWMDGWMDAWMDVWMTAWIDGLLGRRYIGTLGHRKTLCSPRCQLYWPLELQFPLFRPTTSDSYFCGLYGVCQIEGHNSQFN